MQGIRNPRASPHGCRGCDGARLERGRSLSPSDDRRGVRSCRSVRGRRSRWPPWWREAERLSVERGLVAVAYERRNHEFSRIHQFALNYVVGASLDVYSCPLAMTDGAARTLLDIADPSLIERALPRLTSRDPK